MNWGKIFSQLNIFAHCQKYGLSLWQCPQFLFLMMGIIIIGASILSYSFGTRYIGDPLLVAFLVMVLAGVLLVIDALITHSFERMAEVARMKTEFVNVVSHQLRSPLTNLQWALQLLWSEKAELNEKQLEYFKMIKENSARMQELVKDLLIVSRLAEPKLSLIKKEISLEDQIRELILKFEPLAQASQLKIKFEPQENLPKVFTDPRQIRLVIENLLDNAIRYSKTGGKIEISLFKQDQNLYFEIKDNGIGIPQEDQKYIFQKFFRSKNVLQTKILGSGLGLYIAKAIIEKLGGKIGFQSEEGQGSTFWFSLPIK